jgi:predicted RNase H-like nuclease (RuvC/YqgF family)
MGAVLSALLMAACQTQPVKPEEPSPQTDPRYETLSEEKKGLEKSLAKSEASRKDLDEKISDLQLRLLEKDSQIKSLEEQLRSQQKALDDAFLEVVRSKAKLRSLETKAEAASNMAEAEIAVKALKVESGAGDQDADVRRAEQLLKMSADEFNNENYGGALYLTNQAKAHIKAGQVRLRAGEGMSSHKGETLFSQPIELKLLQRTSLRQDPASNSKDVGRLEKGRHVLGYSTAAGWIRVEGEDGVRGWVLRSAVGAR